MTSSFRISFVVPVFNSESSIGKVVDRLWVAFQGKAIQIILVNDGSHDASDEACRRAMARYPEAVEYLELSRNFGEHAAVLAGLARCKGSYIAVLDDDGQNPPEEIPRMLDHLMDHQFDVVYGRYVERKHAGWRRLGSWMNDRIANVMLSKPRGIYLSSFKVMTAFLVHEIVKYQGPFPYIDGLICRTTQRIGQIDVVHSGRLAGASNYNLRRLIRLWLNMALGFSILPLRVGVVIGFIAALGSCFWFAIIVLEKVWLNPGVTVGISSVLATISFFAGVQLILLGVMGEYVGRTFLSTSGMPQYIVRYHSGGVE